jgi:transcriptional regulator with XRE-family HTH domain
MKSFAEKVKEARENLDISQAELAEKVGVSQRSITAYENENTIPRGQTIRKLARALNVSFDYLMNETDIFIDTARDNYGSKGAKEAERLLEANKALFAGGNLSQEAKDAFFEALMVAYVTCKEEAKKTFGRKERAD